MIIGIVSGASAQQTGNLSSIVLAQPVITTTISGNNGKEIQASELDRPFSISFRLGIETIAGVRYQTVESDMFKGENGKNKKGDSLSSYTQGGNSSSESDKATKIIPVLDIAVTSGDNYKPLTGKQRWKLFLEQNFTTPDAYFRSLLPALQDHLGNSPHEWGKGIAGFSRRYLSNMGLSLLEGSIQAPTAAVLGLDTRYIQCPCKGFLRRSRHAIIFNFLTYN